MKKATEQTLAMVKSRLENMAKVDGVKVKTNLVRIVYENVFEPSSFDPQKEKKYSATILIEKSNTKLIEAIKQAMKEAATDKWSAKIPHFKTPLLRDGDDPSIEYDFYKGHYFMRASSKVKPSVVGVDNKPLDANSFWGGCWGIITFNVFGYDTAGNKGLSAGLHNVLGILEGDRIAGGAVATEKDFEEELSILSDIAADDDDISDIF